MEAQLSQKILVVDDDADLRRLIAAALKPLGTVAEAPDGKAALRRLRTLKPVLLLLDVSMPGMDGIAVLRAARELDPNLVVVMLTSESDVGVAKKALDLGARTYITKPFDIDVVYAEIERLLDERSHRSPPPSDRPWRVAVP
jgi:DNA-binding response OmpR family regulator